MPEPTKLRLVLVLYRHGIAADRARQRAVSLLDIQPCGVLDTQLMAASDWQAMTAVAVQARRLACAAEASVVLCCRQPGPADPVRYGMLAYADACVQVLRTTNSLIEAVLVKHPTAPVVPIDWTKSE